MGNKEYVNYLGYRIDRHGIVTDLDTGKIIEIAYINGTNYVSLHYKSSDGETIHIRPVITRLMYSLFYDVKLKRTEFVVCADKNRRNIDLDNLVVMTRTEYYDFIGKRNSIKKMFTPEIVNEICSSYNPDKHYKNQYDKDGYSIRDLAKKYNCSQGLIQRILSHNYIDKEVADHA